MKPRQPIHSVLERHGEVIGLLARYGPTTRSHLEQATGVTRVSVARWVDELIHAGIVRELGTLEESRPGRPSTLIDLVPTAMLSAAISLSDSVVELGLVDVKGQVILSDRLPYDENRGVLFDAVFAHLQKMIRQSDCPPERVIGVGVSSIGLVDDDGVESRLVEVDGGLQEEKLPLRSLIESRSPWPIEAEMNTWAMAAGERWFGSKLTDFLLIYVKGGIGTAVYLHGELQRGIGTAGEVGLNLVSLQPDEMDVQVQNAVTSQAIARRVGPPMHSKRLSEILKEAPHNSAVEKSLLSSTKAISLIACPILDALGIDTVITSGPIFAAPQVPTHLESLVIKDSFVGRFRGVKVLPTVLGDHAELIGAASLVFSRYCNSTTRLKIGSRNYNVR